MPAVFDVFESDARSTRPGFFVTAVADDGRYRIIPVADSDLDERGVVITYSVLERVFDEYDQQRGAGWPLYSGSSPDSRNGCRSLLS